MHCYSASSVASVFRSSGYKHTNVTGNHDCGCTSPNWSRFVCVYAKGKENVKFSVWFVLSNTKRIDWGGGSLPPRNLGLGTRWRSDRSASRPNCFILGGRAVWGIRNDENAVKYREWSQLLSSHWTDSYPDSRITFTTCGSQVYRKPKHSVLLRDSISTKLTSIL